MNLARAVRNPTNSNPISSTSTRNDQNNPDLNDTSETNQELRREALKIFQETQTNQQSGTVQVQFKTLPRSIDTKDHYLKATKHLK